MPNYARRQVSSLVHAGEAALGSVIAALLGLAILSAGAAALAGLLLVTAVGLGLYARRWLSPASRSRVGARAEDEVQRALAPLQYDGRAESCFAQLALGARAGRWVAFS
jgi:hypothetical protein